MFEAQPKMHCKQKIHTNCATTICKCENPSGVKDTFGFVCRHFVSMLLTLASSLDMANCVVSSNGGAPTLLANLSEKFNSTWEHQPWVAMETNCQTDGSSQQHQFFGFEIQISGAFSSCMVWESFAKLVFRSWMVVNGDTEKRCKADSIFAFSNECQIFSMQCHKMACNLCFECQWSTVDNRFLHPTANVTFTAFI